MPIQEYLDKIGLEHLVENLKQINVRVAEQDLTEEQQNQVRINIGAVSADDVESALIASLITDTASGDPCAIPDGASAPVVDCKVSIVPKQEGSGTPSPDNVRPISGWTEMAMKRMGKNLCYTDSYVVPKNSIRNTVWEGDLTGTFTVSVEKSGITSVTKPNEAIALVKVDGVKQELIYQTGKLTVTGNVTMIEVWGYEAYARAVGTLGIQMEVGSTATAYEPYTEYDYTQSWDTTVYGGELDLTTGVLTVTYGMVDLGSLAWTIVNSTYGTFQSSIADAKVPTGGSQVANCLHPYYVVVSSNVFNNVANTGYFVVNSSDHFVRFCTGDSSIQPSGGLVYELAEPTTIQLTPTEVQTILGSNTFSADTGAVSLEYRCDTKLYITKIIS